MVKWGFGRSFLTGTAFSPLFQKGGRPKNQPLQGVEFDPPTMEVDHPLQLIEFFGGDEFNFCEKMAPSFSRACLFLRLPMKKKQALLVALLVFYYFSLKRSLLLADEPKALRGWFLQEAPKQWRKYKARATRLQGSILWKDQLFLSSSSEKKWEDTRFEIKQGEGSALFLWQGLGGSSSQNSRAGTLYVTNPRYGFQLFRRLPDRPWTVSFLGKEINIANLGTPRDWVNKFANSAYSFWLIAPGVGTFNQDPGFSIKRITPFAREGRKFIKVEFAYQTKDLVRVPLREGWVVYDPEKYWVIREFEIQMSWVRRNKEVKNPDLKNPKDFRFAKGIQKGTYKYLETGDGFPILKKFTLKIHIPEEGLENTQTYDFHLKEADPPESEFTLSGFGFTEPVEAPQPPTRWYLWAGGGALVCLALAVLLRRFGRRTPSGGEVGQVPTGAGK